jgi:hypothetical protein
MSKLLFLLFCIFLACNNKTFYEPIGISDEQLEYNKFSIVFESPKNILGETMASYVVKRALEVCNKHGEYNNFNIIYGEFISGGFNNSLYIKPSMHLIIECR